MTYLYGDSSPSALTINYLEFLRDALDFSVQAVQAMQRLDAGSESKTARGQAAEVEIERLRTLEAIVTRAIAGTPTGAGDSPAARCAASIGRAVTDIVRGDVEGVRARLRDEVAKTDADGNRAREGCVRALETLLKKHDLPGMTSALSLRLTDGNTYRARLAGTTALGLEVTLELEVPPSHLLGNVLRLERVVERLEVQLPEASGWFEKKMKLRPQRLERYYLAELTSAAAEATIRLRSAPTGSGEGFDVQLTAEPQRVRLSRVGDAGEVVGTPFDLDDADGARLFELQNNLVGATRELWPNRKALLDARLDGRPLATHDRPTLLVERLVAAMAPVVREIADHSLTPNELVLKRLVGDDRREEIFVAKSELTRKIAAVPEQHRALFAPLGLGDPGPRVAQPPQPPQPPSPPPPPQPAAKAVPNPVAPEISVPAIPIEEPSIVLSMEADAEEDDEHA